MTKYRKVLIDLPSETADELITASGSGDRELVKSYVYALRTVGWTFESISRPLGVSRERVRQIYAEVTDPRRAERDVEDFGFVVPERPAFPEKLKRAGSPEPSVDGLARLRELQPLVQMVRAKSLNHRAEAEEFAALLNKEHVDGGVPLYKLAKYLGVSHAAVRSRLIRYGYMKTTGTSRAYTPIVSGHRS